MTEEEREEECLAEPCDACGGDGYFKETGRQCYFCHGLGYTWPEGEE